MTSELQWGAQSMTAPLRRVLVVPPGPGHDDADVLAQAGWRPIDRAAIDEQFQQLVELLEGAGAAVDIGEPAPTGNPDAVYCYDPLLVTEAGALYLRPPKPNRVREPFQRAPELEALSIPTHGVLEAPAVADGGDCLWLAPDHLAIGLSWRTNSAAAEQLQEDLEPLGVRVEAFDVPNFRGESVCLHLLSLVSLVSADVAVIDADLIPVRLVRRLQERGFQLVEAEPDEIPTLATNVLSLGEGQAIALAANTTTNRKLRALGIEVLELHAPDLCVAGTGGPTCLTRPLWRDMPASFC